MDTSQLFIAFFITLIYGVTVVLHKQHLQKCDVSTLFVIYGFVYALGIMVIGVINMTIIRKDLSALKPVDSLAIAATALAGLIIANYLYLYLLKHHQSFLISALVSCAPLFTLLFAYLFLKEKITLTAAFGVFLIVIGVICLTL
jgi:drug/metabolite transporter (DMT)-like permease